MARILIVGSVAVDEIVELVQPIRGDAHLDGRLVGRRLGGGAANTGRPLVKAGHQVTLVSAVGSDEDGDWLLAELASAGLDTSAVVRVPGASTRTLVLLDPSRERTVVNLRRCVEPGGPARLRDLPADAIYVRGRESGLAPLVAPRLAGTLVLAHVPPTTPGSRPAHVLVGSEADLSEAELRAPWELGVAVGGPCLRAMVVTRGARGAESFSAAERHAVPARRVPVVDSTGAGDAFAAGLIHALVGGAAIPAALETACAWGAEAVSGGRLS